MAGSSPTASTGAPAPTRLHLAAAVCALVLLALVVAFTAWRSGRVLATHGAHASLAPWRGRIRGLATHRAALADPTRIPVFGSSELSHDVDFRPDRLFGNAPSGFTVYPMGEPGVLLMHHVLEAAAIGEQLRGRRVLVFVPPNEFSMRRKSERQQFFAGNFSRVQAATMLAQGALPDSLQRDILARLAVYHAALAMDPLIAAEAQLALRGRSRATTLATAALQLPMRLEAAWLTIADRVTGARAVRAHPRRDRDAVRLRAPIAWDSLEQVARAEYLPGASSNRYGLPDAYWERLRGASTDGGLRHVGERFDRQHEDAAAWGELELLVRTLAADGARPLLVCLPLPGLYMDDTGGNAAGRADFYAQLRAFAARAGIPMIDFASLDARPGLLVDLQTHLSPVGWLAVDEAIDSVMHGDYY
ncbi:MAG: D-alanyl-lipoteichoic acid biosynthesis protein DltD [Gemmatimonadota bacterium]